MLVSLPVEPSLPVESSQARNYGAIRKTTNPLAVHNRANLLSPVDVEVIFSKIVGFANGLVF